MSTILQYIRSFQIPRNLLEFILWMTIGFAMFYMVQYVLNPFDVFSQFPAGILRGMLGIGMQMYMVKTHMGGISLAKAIEDKNLAYAVVFFSYAFIIGSVMMTI